MQPLSINDMKVNSNEKTDKYEIICLKCLNNFASG